MWQRHSTRHSYLFLIFFTLHSSWWTADAYMTQLLKVSATFLDRCKLEIRDTMKRPLYSSASNCFSAPAPFHLRMCLSQGSQFEGGAFGDTSAAISGSPSSHNSFSLTRGVEKNGHAPENERRVDSCVMSKDLASRLDVTTSPIKRRNLVRSHISCEYDHDTCASDRRVVSYFLEVDT